MSNETQNAQDVAQVETTEQDYINGSDMLLDVGGKCVGHCTSHKIQYNTDTKSHNVKPPESSTEASAGLYSEETVTGLNYTIDFEGLQVNNEDEESVDLLRAAWDAHKPITVTCFKRGNKTTPVLKGKCILTSLSEDFPAQDDSTYTGSLKNFGAPESIKKL